jgi:aromatic-L-amino-acid decarboxylase
MSVKEQGVAKYRALIEQNVDDTRYLLALVEAVPDLVVAAPAPLNIACIRFRPAGASAETVDQLNRQIVILLHERGIAVPSGGIVGGQYVIRVANTNQRSRREDFGILVRAIHEIGNELLAIATAA